MNKQYLAQLSDDDFLELVNPYIKDGTFIDSKDQNEKIITVRDNVETLSRINHYLRFIIKLMNSF